MLYSEHPACNIPKDMNQKVWRYMDFTKFVFILEEQALFFPRLSSLSLSDPLEGFLTKPTVAKFRNIPEGLTAEEVAKKRAIREHNLSVLRMGRNLLFVSSWYVNSHESIAMWKLYLKSGEGVAIQSTTGRMIESFANTEDKVFIGLIDYIDYDEDEIPWDNLFYLALHKRKSFEHEREIRAIVMSPDNLPGKLIPVDLDILIDKVFIAPNSPAWIHDLIKKVLARYGLNIDIIHHSGLEQKPMY
jgi:hypothetical protein